MADTPEIKQIKIAETTYNIKDESARQAAASAAANAVNTVNGYSNSQVNGGSVYFANTRITEEEIENILNGNE